MYDDGGDLESQLRQRQMLESIGRLAGGIAHDFKHLLTIIDTDAMLVRDSLGTSDARGDDLAQVRSASSRAAELCAQRLSRYAATDLSPPFCTCRTRSRSR